jgi:SepF-like predicted cell division protein (DUF552 family)
MQYRNCSRFTVGSYTFNFSNEVEIESSWVNLTDTATITLPKNITVDKKPIIEGNNSIFKIGDKVKIELGYNYEYDTVFEGYLSDVKVKVPLELKCEDAMWLFKQVSFKKTFKQVTVKELVSMVNSKLKTPVTVVYTDPSIQLGAFRISNATGAQILEELRKKYGIYSFFREGKLYVGFAYSHTASNYRNTIPLQFNRNIVEDDLIYKNKDNKKVKIKAVSIHSDNKQELYETGDGDGVVVDVFYYNKSHSDLKKIADNLANTYRVSGFEGSVTTFGKPYVRQGDAIQLSDSRTTERNGTYLVRKVKRVYGANGYRQTIEIDRKLS